jgi:hypothetical protein
MAMPPQASPAIGPSGKSARLGFNPNRPHDDAGMRTEPPPSLPWASGTTPAATAAPEPPLLPPATWSVFQGLRVGRPYTTASVVGPTPNSGLAVRPNVARPVERRRLKISLS